MGDQGLILHNYSTPDYLAQDFSRNPLYLAQYYCRIMAAGQNVIDFVR